MQNISKGNEEKKTENRKLVISVNQMPYNIDFEKNCLGLHFTDDIKEPKFHYFQKRFLERMKAELSIDFSKEFKGSPQFEDMYTSYHSIFKGFIFYKFSLISLDLN